jgi:predicted TIM-barrel fold metal-dependent hydrolase
MRPVLDLAGPRHIVFGSDFPYVHGDVLDFEIQQFDQLDAFDEPTRSMAARQNALELFPRLARKTAAAK